MITLSATLDDTVSADGIETGKPYAVVLPRTTLSDTVIGAMYALYADNYAATNEAMFRRDLAQKTHVLLLNDAYDSLCGFSTLELYDSCAGGQPVRVIYSGDTIINPANWGSSALAFEWLRFAGCVQREDPDRPLYWLLIVKGHRTYRFLSTFARRYVPHHVSNEVTDWQQRLNALAQEKFGDEFDSRTGIFRPALPSGWLNDSLADVPARHQRLAAVRYFLQRNPGYRNGDELVCLCELAPENLKPLALRVFAPTTA